MTDLHFEQYLPNVELYNKKYRDCVRLSEKKDDDKEEQKVKGDEEKP